MSLFRVEVSCRRGAKDVLNRLGFVEMPPIEGRSGSRMVGYVSDPAMVAALIKSGAKRAPLATHIVCRHSVARMIVDNGSVRSLGIRPIDQTGDQLAEDADILAFCARSRALDDWAARAGRGLKRGWVRFRRWTEISGMRTRSVLACQCGGLTSMARTLAKAARSLAIRVACLPGASK